MTDVKVVAPMNMGTRLVWDEVSKKYNVDVDDLINGIDALKSVSNAGDVVYQKIGNFEIRKFPGGTMIQTGKITGLYDEKDVPVTFALSFAEAPSSVQITETTKSTSSAHAAHVMVLNLTNTGFTAWRNSTQDSRNAEATFLAIGKWR